MSNDENPTPATAADALAFALRFQGRKRVHNADEFMSVIVAERLVEHLKRSGFVIMKKPPLCGGGALGRGFQGAADRPRPTEQRLVMPSCPAGRRSRGSAFAGLQ